MPILFFVNLKGLLSCALLPNSKLWATLRLQGPVPEKMVKFNPRLGQILTEHSRLLVLEHANATQVYKTQ